MTACAGCGTPSYSAAKNCASCPAFSEWPIDPDEPAERKPSAGWVEGADGQWRLRSGSILAHVVPGTDNNGGAVWRGQVGASNGTDHAAFVFAILWERSLESAQFAAEDALLEIASAIVGAVRR